MKKSSFTALLLGMISGVIFALGMCMTLLPEWNAFIPGTVLGIIGIVMILVTIFIWRKMEHKEAIKVNGKSVFAVLMGIVGSLVLGLGMCLVMVWSHLIGGIIVGLAGMILLIMIIPIWKGLT